MSSSAPMPPKNTGPSRKKSTRPLGRPHLIDNVRAKNIAVLYDALRRLRAGEPLVSIIDSLSDEESPHHLILKTGWRTVLPDWRELSTVTKELVRQLALHRTGTATAFNVNLGRTLLAKHVYGSRESAEKEVTRGNAD